MKKIQFTVVLLTPDGSTFENSVGPDQVASEVAKDPHCFPWYLWQHYMNFAQVFALKEYEGCIWTYN